jgi:putative phosphoribosyl transferase
MASSSTDATSENRVVRVTGGQAQLEGELHVPANGIGVVLFAHGSGSSRHSPRNQYVARALRERALGTFLVDLLTIKEEQVDAVNGRLRFDIGLLADRLAGIIDWLRGEPATQMLPIGLFGASTGGAAALVAASLRPEPVKAVVSRGGRPDLAGPVLPSVKAPTLLIVGADDTPVIELNRLAMSQMRTEVKLAIVPRASHLFDEPGALAQVAAMAGDWFERFLPPEPRR